MSKNRNYRRGQGHRRDSQARTSLRARRQRQHHLSVRGELRERPDVHRIARAIIEMEMARLEAEAQAQQGDESGDVGAGEPTHG